MRRGTMLRSRVAPCEYLVLIDKEPESGVDGVPMMWRVFSLQESRIRIFYEHTLKSAFWERVA